MALNRSQINLPALPKEAVQVDALGGEVVVRGLLLRERLQLFTNLREDGQAYANISQLLAMAVEGEDGKPLLTADEWEVFGATQIDAALSLFAVVRRLSGLDADLIEKN